VSFLHLRKTQTSRRLPLPQHLHLHNTHSVPLSSAHRSQSFKSSFPPCDSQRNELYFRNNVVMRESHWKSTLDLLLYILERKKKVHVLCSVRYFSPFQYQPFFRWRTLIAILWKKLHAPTIILKKGDRNLTDKWRGKALCFDSKL
jgi:hypothetical protein